VGLNHCHGSCCKGWLEQLGSLTLCMPPLSPAISQQMRSTSSLSADALDKQSLSRCARQAVSQQMRSTSNLSADALDRQSLSRCARQAVIQQMRLTGSLSADALDKQSLSGCARQAISQRMRSTSRSRGSNTRLLPPVPISLVLVVCEYHAVRTLVRGSFNPSASTLSCCYCCRCPRGCECIFPSSSWTALTA
jgi:hypothetical protein